MQAATRTCRENCSPKPAPPKPAQPGSMAAPPDATALAELMKTHSRMFLRAATRVLGSDQGAEDVLQDAMVLALRHLAQFEGRARLSTWLGTIVVNTARVHRRKLSRHRIISLETPLNEDGDTIEDVVASNLRSPEESCLDQLSREDLHRKIDRLPGNLQNVLRLHLEEGLSIEEMAERLQVSVAATKSRLHRARMRLQAPRLRRQHCGSVSA